MAGNTTMLACLHMVPGLRVVLGGSPKARVALALMATIMVVVMTYALLGTLPFRAVAGEVVIAAPETAANAACVNVGVALLGGVLGVRVTGAPCPTVREVAYERFRLGGMVPGVPECAK